MPSNGKPWTDKELKYLEKVYPMRGAQHCAKHLKRGVWSIYTKASDLAIPRGFIVPIARGEAYDIPAIAADIGGDFDVSTAYKWFAVATDGVMEVPQTNRTLIKADVALEYIEWNRDLRDRVAARWLYTPEAARELRVGRRALTSLHGLRRNTWLLSDLDEQIIRSKRYPNGHTLWHPQDIAALAVRLDQRARVLDKSYTRVADLRKTLSDMPANSALPIIHGMVKRYGGHVWRTGTPRHIPGLYVSNNIRDLMLKRYSERITL